MTKREIFIKRASLIDPMLHIHSNSSKAWTQPKLKTSINKNWKIINSLIVWIYRKEFHAMDSLFRFFTVSHALTFDKKTVFFRSNKIFNLLHKKRRNTKRKWIIRTKINVCFQETNEWINTNDRWKTHWRKAEINFN